MLSPASAHSGIFLRAAVLCLTFCIPVTADDDPKNTAFVAVFDFSPPSKDGAALADAVRMKLARAGKEWNILDPQSLNESGVASPELNTSPDELRKILSEQAGAHVCIFGEMKTTARGEHIANVRIFDIRKNPQQIAKYTFVDKTERWRGIIAQKIVETLTGQKTPAPPQYGDESFPTADELRGPLNVNSSFDVVPFTGWESPDNAASYIIDKPNGGKMLYIRTDIDRDEWLTYRKALLAGQATTTCPPQIKLEAKDNTIAGQEGVHYKSDFLPADVNATYWLRASCRFSPTCGHESVAQSKVFIKGFKATPAAFDGLPESSLKKLKMTPAEFSALPQEKRRQLIETDVKKHPQKYLRECYRWYLSCPASREWKTYQAKFPPRGKLPQDVQFFQIQIYSYWPPGEYFWDNVELYVKKDASNTK